MGCVNRVFYAGHIVPYMVDEKTRTHCSEVGTQAYNDYMNYVKNMGEKLKSYVSRLEESHSLSLVEKLQAIGDFIAAYYRLPLTLPLYPRRRCAEKMVSERIVPDVSEIFWLWVLTRHDRRLAEELWSKPLIEISSLLIKYVDCLMNISGIRGIMELSESAINTASTFPADTRPGLNTSKLLIHLLSTSAIASCKAVASGVKDVDLEILRIASLLHDIGKPVQWFSEDPLKRSHAEESSLLAKKILEGILEDRIVEDIETLIKFHHNCRKLDDKRLSILCKMLSDADRASSQVDRLVEMVADVVAESLGRDVDEVKLYLKETGADAWKFWISIPPEKIKVATESAARKLFEERIIPPKNPADAPRIRDVFTIVCDVRGIQDYIHVESLRSLATRSFIVDLVTIYAIPRTIMEVMNVPPENVMYSGGGIAVILAPSDTTGLEEELIRHYNNLVGRIKEYSVAPEITIASTNLYGDWRTTFMELQTILSIRKLEAKTKVLDWPLILGFERLCDVCGRIPVGKGEEKCYVCKGVEKIADKLYFPMKLDRLKSMGFEVGEWRDLRERIIEWLAGHDDLERIARMYNIAIVKVDGNLMGTFMGDSLSVTDAVERSMRVDRALKRALHMLLDLLKDYSKYIDVKDEVDPGELRKAGFLRLFVGLLYAGGDDALMVIPSWLSIPASLYLSYWFWRELGGCRQLSAGIASGKVKHNIWALADSASALLEECKSVLRLKLGSRESEVSEKLRSLVSILSFAFTEQANLMPAHVREVLGSKLSRQPYAYTQPEASAEAKLFPDILKLMEFALGEYFEEKTSINEALSNLVVEAFRAFKYVREGRDHPVVTSRSVVLELHKVGSTYGDVRSDPETYTALIATYVARQMARLGERSEASKRYSKMGNLILDGGLKVPPLYDVYMLSKFLMGGAR